MIRLTSLFIAAAAAGIAVGTTAAPAVEMSPELKAVAKAADAEGSMKVVWLPGILDGGRGMQQVQNGMNRMFGTHVQIKFAPGGSMPQMGNKMAAEFKAGRPSTSDIYITSLNNAARLSRTGMFRPIPWTKILPGRITDEMVEAGGAALRFESTLTGVLYNTKLVPNPPKTLQGWLAPEYKGKIATTPYAAGFDAMGANDVWGHDKTIAYAKALTGQISGLIQCSENNRVATGEFAAMILACGADAKSLIEKGAPLALITPLDYVSSAFFYLLVPKNAQSPNAATLMIAYLMSPEGQKLTWELDRADLAMFPESRMAADVKAVLKSGAKVVVQSIAWAEAHPEKEAALREVTAIFSRK